MQPYLQDVEFLNGLNDIVARKWKPPTDVGGDDDEVDALQVCPLGRLGPSGPLGPFVVFVDRLRKFFFWHMCSAPPVPYHPVLPEGESGRHGLTNDPTYLGHFSHEFVPN